MVSGKFNKWEISKVNELKPKYVSEEWLHWRRGGRLDARTVRISATTRVGTSNYKAPGGLMRVTAEEVEGKLNEVVISGDFFMLPVDAISNLENSLKGATVENGDLLKKINEAYSKFNIESPGITTEDIETAVKLAFEQK